MPSEGGEGAEVSLLIARPGEEENDSDRSDGSRGDGLRTPDEGAVQLEEAMKRADALRKANGLSAAALAAPPIVRGPRRQGVNVALQLAEPTAGKIVSCGACGLWLLRGNDVLLDEKHAVRITLDDSDAMLCARTANTRVIGTEFVINAIKKARTDDDWAYTVRNIGCARCGLFLGVEVLRTTEPAMDLMQNIPSVIRSRAELLLWLLFETSRKHASISAPRSTWLQTQQVKSRAASSSEPPGGGSNFPAPFMSGAVEGNRMHGGYSGANAAASPEFDIEESRLGIGGDSCDARRRSWKSCWWCARWCQRRAKPCGRRSANVSAMERGNFSSPPTSARNAPNDQVQVVTSGPSSSSSTSTSQQASIRLRASAAGGSTEESQRRANSSTSPIGGRLLRTEDRVPVAQFFLGIRYLRVLDSGGRHRKPMFAAAPIICAEPMCRNVLSYADMILDCNRRWGLGDGPPERAMFMNTLSVGSYSIRNRHEHRLAQGLFDMADVHCLKCGKAVGYAFLKDKSEEQRNINQVGRFGLVCSQVSLANDEKVWVHSGWQHVALESQKAGRSSRIHRPAGLPATQDFGVQPLLPWPAGNFSMATAEEP